MKKNIFTTIVLVLFLVDSSAQQLFLSSLYNVNKFQINSAYAGLNNSLEGNLSSRSQWVGLDGAPSTQYLSLHSRIGENTGLGVNLAHDRTGILSNFFGLLTYAYGIKIGQEHNVRFAISAGITQLNLSVSDAIVNDETDDIFVSGNQSNKAFKNEFSLLYSYKRLQFGVSVPQIFETNADYQLTTGQGRFGLKRHFISYLEYNFDLKEKISVQPSLVYRTFNGIQNQVDVNTQITYNNTFSIGAGYRTDVGLITRFGLKIGELFTVAYAYEFASGKMASVSSGSHEVLLGIKLSKKKNEKIVEVPPIIAPEPDIIEKESVNEKNFIVEEPITTIEKPIEKTKQIDLSVFKLKVKFPLNNSNLDKSFEKDLDKIVDVMLENPELNITIVGHSCDIGTTQIKKEIANQRAEIVKTYLVKKGVETTRINTKGVSDTQQVVPNISEENRAKNRRVEFLLEDKNK